ncbi:hypothetical protein GKA01_18160 [Gluconobacter kanchanaburiensis NBRC 103587]|uniref:Uncharacterized protein n=1 Tax=Gluconobacter kanchanaburiensis NBRC 103587 TaxID=1307948 RepID=A0A511B871_9PROT|nr:hypothetical protein AA103587_2288 [Gluconobacter kanchanaburiensis NBRC 103587]GEK96619.1 hypothetical protein GKA01_18160 [Gluconobacter kanchanaburiensis NBRC 103587]
MLVRIGIHEGLDDADHAPACQSIFQQRYIRRFEDQKRQMSTRQEQRTRKRKKADPWRDIREG